MKGLLLKDFYLSWRYCRAFLVIVAVFLAVSFTGDDNIFFLIYPIMIASVIPMTLVSYDEHDKWTAYSGTLPYTRAQLVSTKYLVGMCFGSVAFLISMAATTVRMILGGGFVLEQFAVVGTALLVLGCLGPALILPYVFNGGHGIVGIGVFGSCFDPSLCIQIWSRKGTCSLLHHRGSV